VGVYFKPRLLGATLALVDAARAAAARNCTAVCAGLSWKYWRVCAGVFKTLFAPLNAWVTSTTLAPAVNVVISSIGPTLSPARSGRMGIQVARATCPRSWAVEVSTGARHHSFSDAAGTPAVISEASAGSPGPHNVASSSAVSTQSSSVTTTGVVTSGAKP